jgi:uncharacterized protein DUF488
VIDRLWPRGLSRRKAAIDQWMRELAPSTELRRWFAHDPAKWREFKRRYAPGAPAPAVSGLAGRRSEAGRRGEAARRGPTEPAAHDAPDCPTAGARGRRLIRLPVSANQAFATAGATGGTGGSPRPLGARVLGTKWTSTTGASFMRSSR